MDAIRKDDVIVVPELTRFSRSTKDLFSLVETIQKAGGNIKSLKESWLDTTTTYGKIMFTIFAGISQFERDLISDRTREGLEAARVRGRKGGRPPKVKNLRRRIYPMLSNEVTPITQYLNYLDSSFSRKHNYII